MKCHQVLTGACNVGDKSFSVGSVEGVTLIAYAAGCNIIILANTFHRVQIIPGICHNNVQITCVDVSNDTGKIAVAYENKVKHAQSTNTFNCMPLIVLVWCRSACLSRLPF